MINDESLRYLGFKCYDLLNGRELASQLRDLNDYFINPKNYEVHEKNSLNQLLEHACTTVPFYKPFTDFSSINDFPVVEKPIIKKNYDQFISSAYKRSSLNDAISSGSYGTPMTYLHTKDKSARRLAEVLLFNQWAGYRVGMKHVLVRVRPKSRWTCFNYRHLI